MSLVLVLVRLYLAAWDGDACAADEAAYRDMHEYGACTWDEKIQDGTCTDEGYEVLHALFLACHATLNPAPSAK